MDALVEKYNRYIGICIGSYLELKRQLETETDEIKRKDILFHLDSCRHAIRLYKEALKNVKNKKQIYGPGN